MLSVPGPRRSAFPVSLHPTNARAPQERRTASLSPLHGWANGGWEVEQVLQGYIIKTKETESGFDPRSVLLGGLCFNHYTLDGVRGHPRQPTAPRIHGNIQGDQRGPTECGVRPPAFPSARYKGCPGVLKDLGDPRAVSYPSTHLPYPHCKLDASGCGERTEDEAHLGIFL